MRNYEWIVRYSIKTNSDSIELGTTRVQGENITEAAANAEESVDQIRKHLDVSGCMIWDIGIKREAVNEKSN